MKHHFNRSVFAINGSFPCSHPVNKVDLHHVYQNHEQRPWVNVTDLILTDKAYDVHEFGVICANKNGRQTLSVRYSA